LEKDLETALEQERDYRLRNDAKFRAANQKAATYEEFKGIVDLAHLQPLSKQDYRKDPSRDTNNKRIDPWTPLTNS